MLRFIFLLLSLSVCSTAFADVLISEIMYNPDEDDTEREWVEIYNNGATAVDLGGWTLEDLQDAQVSTPIPAGTMLAPGQALALVNNAGLFDAQWGAGINRLSLGDYPTFANSPSFTNELVALRDNVGILRDQVNYDDANGWPSDSPDGSSIFVAPSGLSTIGNNSGSNWLPSMWGVYGAQYTNGPGGAGDRASPGFVASTVQTAFTPSPDVAWSMVVLPDTQNYVKTAAHTGIFTQMTEWVRDNKTAFNIQLVLHEGDIVNNNNTNSPTSGDQTGTQQWQHAAASMSVLNGEVPYIMATGNHEYGTTNAQDRSTQFNTFFQATDNPLNDPAQGGILKGVQEFGHLENAYYELDAPDGRSMLIFSLEWGPRQQVVNWANQVASQPRFADHTVMLLTHAYMYHDETRYDWDRNLDGDPNNDQGGNPHNASNYGTANDPDGTHDGEELWNELVRTTGNFEMVLSGHVGGDGVGYLESTADNGHSVHQMLFNSQFEVNGGNGWIRVMEFLDDGTTVRVRTYSPFHDLVKDDPANEFFFELSPLEILQPADFDGDGDVDGADFLVWQNGFGIQSGATQEDGDANNDGAVDGTDFLIWQNLFGTGAGSASNAVPEPSAFVTGLFAIAGMCVLLARRYVWEASILTH